MVSRPPITSMPPHEDDGHHAHVGQHQQHRHGDGHQPADLDVLLHVFVVALFEAVDLEVLAGVCLDHACTGQVLLDDGVQRRELALHDHEHGLRNAHDDPDEQRGERQQDEHDHGEAHVDEEHHDEAADDHQSARG